MKFKVGDKVVRTASCSDDYTVKQGGVYVISKVDEECNFVYLQGVYDHLGQPDWFNPDNFELVKTSSEWKQKSKFNKGDKVRCVKSTLAMGVRIGGVYTVKDPQHHESYSDKGWHVTLEEVEGTPNENVLELYEEGDAKDSSKQTPFEKKGWTENSIFKVIDNTISHYFDIGSLVVLHQDDESRQPCFKPQEYHGKEAEYEDCWYLDFGDLEVVSENEGTYLEQQEGVKKLSIQDYTDKSTFKVIGENGSCFEVGDLVIIDSERSEYDARFKLVSEYGKYRKPVANWLKFEGLEYVGELGEDGMVKGSMIIQKDKDYRSMSPDVLIPISIDGNEFEVSLGSLLLARYIVGKANGSYIDSLYCALGVIDKEDQIMYFESQNPLDCSAYENDLFSKYFKDKVKESKKLDIKAQIESLQEQLKYLD